MLGAASDVRISEVRGELAGRADADKPAQRLDAGAGIVGSPFVYFQRPPLGAAFTGPRISHA